LGISEDKIPAWAEDTYKDLQHLDTSPRNYSVQELSLIFRRAFVTGACDNRLGL
jgi:alcohol dehydrogenase class IV